MAKYFKHRSINTSRSSSNFLYADRTIKRRLHTNQRYHNVIKRSKEPILRYTDSQNSYENHQECKWRLERTSRLVWKNTRKIDLVRFQDSLWSSLKTIKKNPREYHTRHRLPSSEHSPSRDNSSHIRRIQYSKERHHLGTQRPQQIKGQHITRQSSEKCINYTKWCAINTYTVSSSTHQVVTKPENHKTITVKTQITQTNKQHLGID